MSSRPTTELGAAKPPIERVVARPGTAQSSGKPPIELKVEYKRLNSFFADYAKNISRGGTFIKTSRPLPIGTEFVFRLRVPVLESQLFIHGEVKRIIADSEVNEADPEYRREIARRHFRSEAVATVARASASRGLIWQVQETTPQFHVVAGAMFRLTHLRRRTSLSA